MNEKSDLATDTESLPPTYAPSEAFTDSPPPAYRQSGVAAVKVAKIICITLLMMTFIIGFFVVTHKWLQSTHMRKHEYESLPTSGRLIDNNIPEAVAKIEETIVKKQSEELSKEVIEEEEEDPILEVLPIEEEEPTLEVLSEPGNSNPKCRIQRKQNKIGSMIMAQTIMVICDDDENEEDNDSSEPARMLPPGMRRLNEPPMSLLGNLMKILASRTPSNEIPREEQRPFLRPINGPIPFPMIRPNQGPMPGPFQARAGHMIPITRVAIRRPNHMLQGANMRPRPIIVSPRGPMPFIRPNPTFRKIVLGSPNPNGPPAPPRFMLNQIQEEEQRRRSPMSFPFGNGATRIIKLPTNNNNEDSEGPVFPFNPLMNLHRNRMSRILHLRPREEESDLPPPHMSMESFARGLPSPVAIPDPEMRIIRLPFQPQPPSFIFPEARVSAGLEVQPQQYDNEENDQPIIIRENSNEADFGPPKTHSVIEAAPKNHSDDQEESKFQPKILAHQAPLNFSPERRISFKQSDAVIKSDNKPVSDLVNKYHRMIIN